MALKSSTEVLLPKFRTEPPERAPTGTGAPGTESQEQPVAVDTLTSHVPGSALTLNPQAAAEGVTVPNRLRGDGWVPVSPTADKFQHLVEQLELDFTDITPPPAGATVKPLHGNDVSLLGLPNSFLDATANYQDNLRRFEKLSIPRFEVLSTFERTHETAFADEVQAHPATYVEGAEILASQNRNGSKIFEVDAMKRMYGPYGTGAEPANAQERKVRLRANHALHPTAVAIARLAFLKALDDLARLPDDSPRKQVLATNGGCAAGKGSLADVLKRQVGESDFALIWDAAGEGDALENEWLLDACLSRGIRIVFAYAANDATVQYPRVVDRARSLGRVVDPITFANSYAAGAKHFREFLSSAKYQAAEQAGQAQAIGVFAGRFNRASLADRSLNPYPEAKPLGNRGVIDAQHIDPGPEVDELIAVALSDIEAIVAHRHDPLSMEIAEAAMTSALKFAGEIP